MAEMSGLAALMAKRKQAETPVEPVKESKDVGPVEVSNPQPATKAANPLAGMFGKNVVRPSAQPTPPAAKQASSPTGRLPVVAESKAVEADRELGAIHSLSDLESLTDEGIAPSNSKREAESEYLRSRMSEFDDETPATKPVRELPSGIESQQLQFVEMMDGVYDLLDDPELLGAVIKNIMIELKANPQYINMVTKDDVRQWVRTMRHTMGLARIKKLETKGNRGVSKAKPKSKLLDEDVINAAAGIDWDNV